MGNMCRRGLCFWTRTILLWFSPSSTTHLEKSQGTHSPDHWRKQQKLPLRAKTVNAPGPRSSSGSSHNLAEWSHQVGKDRQEKAPAERHQESFSLEQLKVNFVPQCQVSHGGGRNLIWDFRCLLTGRREGAKPSSQLSYQPCRSQWQYRAPHSTPAAISLMVSPSGSANSVW